MVWSLSAERGKSVIILWTGLPVKRILIVVCGRKLPDTALSLSCKCFWLVWGVYVGSFGRFFGYYILVVFGRYTLAFLGTTFWRFLGGIHLALLGVLGATFWRFFGRYTSAVLGFIVYFGRFFELHTLRTVDISWISGFDIDLLTC